MRNIWWRIWPIMGTWGSISQRLDDMASPVVIGGTIYAQYDVPPLHGRIGTNHWHNATVGSLQQRILTHATGWPAFGTLLIHSCYGGDLTPQPHNRNDGWLIWNVTNIYETANEFWGTLYTMWVRPPDSFSQNETLDRPNARMEYLTWILHY